MGYDGQQGEEVIVASRVRLIEPAMPKLTRYFQKRYDEGFRTGVELDDDRIVEKFREGKGPRDPALLWYVDWIAEGRGVPADPTLALQWLIDQKPVVTQGFEAFATHLRAGADPDIFALEWHDFDGRPRDVTMRISCSATRRVDARRMAEVLDKIAKNWTRDLRELDRARPA
jgi:hypothetical protein